MDDFAFDAASKSSGGFPFGSRKDGAYPFGTLPSQVSANTAAADANIITHFQALYDHHFKSSLNAIPGGMGPLDAHGAIVSEGIGYWMLLAVTMQGVDMGTDVHGTPRLSPKQIFDGCLATALARPADQLAADNPGDSRDPLTKHLMTWRITGDGDWVPDNNGDKYSAPDGDMDIALALLMAHRQWGSTGTYDYAYLAAQRIAAIKAWHMHSDGTLIAMSKPAGFGVYPSDPAFSLVRTSDFMFNHFRAFARATNDGFWLATNESDPSAFTRAKWLANYIQSNSTSGLLPDFIEGTETSTPYLPKDKLYHGDPSMIVQVVDNAPTGNYGAEDVYDTRAKYFDSNASRNIWRYVTEYVFSGDPGVKTILDKHVTFFKNLMVANGNDPTVIQDSYRLDGTPTQYAQQGEFAEVLGSVMAGMCLEGYATQCDPLWSWNTGASGSGGRNDPGYYAGEIQLMSKLVASGNWWQP